MASALTYTVGTLAGSGTAGPANGPAHTAAVSPQATEPYVADSDNHRVRKTTGR